MKDGWQIKNLGEAAEVIAGQSPQGTAYNDRGTGLPFYQGKKEFGSKFIGEPTTWTTQVTKVANEGDILMSVRAPVGPINFAISKCCIGRGLAAIRSRNGLSRDFLFYFLLLKQDEISGKAGAVFPSISKPEIEKIPIRYPQPIEQQRIVAILDDAFDAIATAKANTEKNLRNARALFSGALDHEVGKTLNNSDSVPLGDLTTRITDGVHKKPVYAKRGIPFVTVRNLTRSPNISFDKLNYISREDHQEFIKRAHPEKGDILITKDGTIGVVRIVDTDREFSIFVSVALIKPIDKNLTRYLAYALQASTVQNQIVRKGAALKHLYLVDLRKLIIPVPLPAERQKIVQTLDKFSERAKQLESIYQAKANQLESLKKSILRDAFAGVL